MPYFFLFQGSGYHRDLHSFPTRRSSDLDPPSAGPSAARADLLARHGGAGGDHGPYAHQSDRPGDRKSTRLNSSHLGISYAVFCLKKKTKRRTVASVIEPVSEQAKKDKYE